MRKHILAAASLDHPLPPVVSSKIPNIFTVLPGHCIHVLFLFVPLRPKSVIREGPGLLGTGTGPSRTRKPPADGPKQNPNRPTQAQSLPSLARAKIKNVK